MGQNQIKEATAGSHHHKKKDKTMKATMKPAAVSHETGNGAAGFTLPWTERAGVGSGFIEVEPDEMEPDTQGKTSVASLIILYLIDNIFCLGKFPCDLKKDRIGKTNIVYV